MNLLLEYGRQQRVPLDHGQSWEADGVRTRGWSAAAAGVLALGATVAALSAGPAAGSAKPAVARTSLRVDFAPSATAVPRGYLLDDGLPFSVARGYGWERTSNGKPLSLLGNGVRRSRPRDARYRTFLQMQSQHGPVRATGQWQAALANGVYDVTVAVGDAASTDSLDTITAQPGTAAQVRLVRGFRPTHASPFHTVTARVRVSHGRLTLSPVGGRNTDLDFVVAVPAAKSRQGSSTTKPPSSSASPTPTVAAATPTGPTSTSPGPPVTGAPTTSQSAQPPAAVVDNFADGGTVSPTCQVTGLDGVLPDTALDQCQAADIAFVAGGLQLTSTAGQLANDNQQDALFKTFNASSGSFTLSARLVGPIDQLTQDYQQAGLFFGPDQLDFVKVEAEHNGTGAPHLTMFYREPGTSFAAGGIVGTVSLPALTSASTLDLTIKSHLDQLTAYYSLNGAAAVQVGTAKVPLAADVRSWFATQAKVGILTSNSNATSTIQATFSKLSISPS